MVKKQRKPRYICRAILEDYDTGKQLGAGFAFYLSDEDLALTIGGPTYRHAQIGKDFVEIASVSLLRKARDAHTG